MVPNTPAESRKDGIVTAICVLVFMISAATGSAYVMLAMSVATLAVVSVIYRERLGRLSAFVIVCAAVIAGLAAFALTNW